MRKPATRGLVYHIRREPLLYAMFLPGLVYLIVFKYVPMYGITVAFQRYNIAKGYFGSEWVGFHYFKYFVDDPFLYRIVRNTLVLSFLQLVFEFPVPIVLALSLNEVRNQGYKRAVQTVSYLPHFVSVVIIVGLLKTFFATDGLVNDLFGALGIPQQNFWITMGWFRPLYVLSGVWQHVGWGSIVYLAALAGIDTELYDAAYVDGANRFRRAWHVTLPGIRPTIVLVLILRIGDLLDVDFEKVLLMYSPTTYEVADVIATYVYRRGLEEMQLSYSTAVGLLNSVVSCMLIVIANYLAKRFTEISLW